MTKSQKIWFWVSAVLFLLPEILWSPIVNLIDAFLQNSNNTVIFRDNFLMDSDNLNFLLIALFVQFLGVLVSSVIIIKSNFNKGLKIFLASLFVILLVITGLVLFFTFSLRNCCSF